MEVNIDLSIFPKIPKYSFLHTIKNNWLIDLSSQVIPTEVQCLVQLDKKFSLPFKDVKKTVFECIKNIEHSFNKFSIDA